MKSKIIILIAVLGMGLINQPTQTGTESKEIGIIVGTLAASAIFCDWLTTKIDNNTERSRAAAFNEQRQQISDHIHQLYGEMSRLNKKYGWSGVNFAEDIKEFFAHNPVLIFEPCVMSQNGSWITPVEFFTNNDEPEIVTFLLNLKCHFNAQQEFIPAA